MGGAECIIYEEIKGSGELLREGGIVLGLLLVEAGVLKHNDVALFGRADHLGHCVSHAVRGKGDVLTEDLPHPGGGRGKTELVLGAIFRPAEMGGDGDDGTFALEVLDTGDGAANAGVVGDSLAIERDVQVAAD